MKIKKTFTKLISILCLCTVLLSSISVFSVSASAASTTPRTFNADSKVTFTVRATGNNASIKFTSTGAKAYGHRCDAPELKLTITPAINGTKVFYIKDSFDLTPSSVSSTLKGLKKGVTYKITIEYLVAKQNICSRNDNCRVSVHDLMYKYPYGRARDPYMNGTWTYQAKNCTITNIKVK